jgi:uncharacterized protein YbjT (DUF2867 family)
LRVLLLGASGMVGQGVLRECLLDSGVDAVTAIARNPISQKHPKLREILLPDIGDLSSVEDQVCGFDACFYCVGIASAGMKEADYRRITFDLTLNAARTLARLNPQMTFIYVSGMGADSTARGSVMWARVRGETENALLQLPFQGVYVFRPGVIQPLHGIKSRTALYRFFYTVFAPITPLIMKMLGSRGSTTEKIGLAMLKIARYGAPKRVLKPPDFNSV